MIAATVGIWPLKHSQETHTSLPAAPFSPPLPVVKKRSHALPLSPWLGHEKEGEWVGKMQGQKQGKKAHDGTK
jgi:hypothetical protein